MKRTIVASLAGAVAVLLLGAPPAEARKTGSVLVPGMHGLRIPAGGVGRGAPGGRGAIKFYSYNRKVSLLKAQMMALLKTHRWKIVSSTKSPRGTMRLKVRRKGRTVHISILGRRQKSSLILRRGR